MALVMEYAVVIIIYLAVGLLIPCVSKGETAARKVSCCFRGALYVCGEGVGFCARGNVLSKTGKTGIALVI